MDQNGRLTGTAAREFEDRAQCREQKQIAADRVSKSCFVEIQASGVA